MIRYQRIFNRSDSAISQIFLAIKSIFSVMKPSYVWLDCFIYRRQNNILSILVIIHHTKNRRMLPYIVYKISQLDTFIRLDFVINVIKNCRHRRMSHRRLESVCMVHIFWGGIPIHPNSRIRRAGVSILCYLGRNLPGKNSYF